MSRLNNKVAIVTGAATGIGEASATALAEAGASVMFSDIDEARGKAKVLSLIHISEPTRPFTLSRMPSSA